MSLIFAYACRDYALVATDTYRGEMRGSGPFEDVDKLRVLPAGFVVSGGLTAATEPATRAVARSLDKWEPERVADDVRSAVAPVAATEPEVRDCPAHGGTVYAATLAHGQPAIYGIHCNGSWVSPAGGEPTRGAWANSALPPDELRPLLAPIIQLNNESNRNPPLNRMIDELIRLVDRAAQASPRIRPAVRFGFILRSPTGWLRQDYFANTGSEQITLTAPKPAGVSAIEKPGGDIILPGEFIVEGDEIDRLQDGAEIKDGAERGGFADDDLADMEAGGFLNRSTGQVTDTTGVGARTAAEVVTGTDRATAALDSSNRLTTEVLASALVDSRLASHIADRTGLSGQHWILKTGEDLGLQARDFDSDPLNGAVIEWNTTEYLNAGETVVVTGATSTGHAYGGGTRYLYYDGATGAAVLTATRDNIMGFDRMFLGQVTLPASHGGGTTPGSGGDNTIPGT